MAEKPVPTGSADEKPFPGPKRKWPAANRARAGCYFRRMPTASPPALLVYTQTAGFRHGSIPKAVAAIRKLGATYEGTFRNHMILPDGSQRHTVWFSIIREEWPEVRAKLVKRLAS